MWTLPSLPTMINGMFSACNAVISSLMIVGLMVYMLAEIISTFLKDYESKADGRKIFQNLALVYVLYGAFIDGLAFE